MPIRKTSAGWFWGSKGPFATKAKAVSVGQAAHASGFKEEMAMSDRTAEFVGTMLHTAVIAHIMHLSVKGTGSYAKHKALQEYYEGIPDLVDTVAESIQGCYGELISGYPAMYGSNESDPLTYLVSIRDYVLDARTDMPQDSQIQNEIDNIATLIDSTLYKLRFLQ